MVRITSFLLGIGFVILIAGLPANSGQSPEGLRAAQVKKGLAAFSHRNYLKAGTLLGSPAAAGDVMAQSVLCYLYTYGRGVPQNYQEAANWCRRAADQGNPEAQYMLGLLYNKGHGVPEDFVQAYKWLNLAATRAAGPKQDFSYRTRDSIATKMSPAQLAEAQALSIEWKAKPELQGSALIVDKCAPDQKCSGP